MSPITNPRSPQFLELMAQVTMTLFPQQDIDEELADGMIYRN